MMPEITDLNHGLSVDAEVSEASGARDAPGRADQLIEVIETYNRITAKMQASHETLVGEFQRLQRELASANTALQRSKRMAALGQMAAGIAHEVRNPLASIRLYAEMLVQDLSERSEQQQIARHIVDAVRGLDSIVGDVLTYARPLKVQLLPGDPADVFDRVIHSLRADIEDASARVVCKIDAKARRVDHDPEMLHRAMINLVRNALEAAGENGVVTLRAWRESDATCLSVADDGSGIADEEIDRIFNPFFTTRATGTGLGLAIVHRIVDAHGGTIAVHNDPASGGAVFTLTLPDRVVSEGV